MNKPKYGKVRYNSKAKYGRVSWTRSEKVKKSDAFSQSEKIRDNLYGNKLSQYDNTNIWKQYNKWSKIYDNTENAGWRTRAQNKMNMFSKHARRNNNYQKEFNKNVAKGRINLSDDVDFNKLNGAIYISDVINAHNINNLTSPGLQARVYNLMQDFGFESSDELQEYLTMLR